MHIFYVGIGIDLQSSSSSFVSVIIYLICRLACFVVVVMRISLFLYDSLICGAHMTACIRRSTINLKKIETFLGI